MEKIMNSPIRYYGGKGTMFNNIIELFPSKDQFDTYVEPYGGSFSIGLKKDPTEVEIYNDLEQNVYSLYKVLSDKNLYPIFKEKCDLAVYCDDFRREYKDKLKEADIDIVDRAFYFFYVNRTSHNGNGGFSLNSSIRRGMSKAVSDFLSCIDRLPELHERLSRLIVSNVDGVSLIRKYNKENSFLYCDPPYEQSTRSGARYKVDMDRKQHEDFLSAVIESKAKILISGYDCDLYKDLTNNGFEIISFQVNTVDTKFNPKTKTEYLWLNY